MPTPTRTSIIAISISRFGIVSYLNPSTAPNAKAKAIVYQENMSSSPGIFPPGNILVLPWISTQI